MASSHPGPTTRPGPDILYQPVAKAPQLENTGIWKAPPILVSGATAYRNGEFLYQDFLYDDHGANAHVRDPHDPRAANTGDTDTGDTMSLPNGTYTYPSDAAYGGNAADLVELRVKPLPGATAFRITLNTMKDASLVAITIALGDATTPLPLPHGANASAPAQWFVTIHGTKVDLLRAGTGTPAAVPPTATVDSSRRQIDVRVPHADWDPRGETVRLAAGVGLWDKVNDRYLTPQLASDAHQPGGAGNLPNPPAFFNIAFRNGEPLPNVKDAPSIVANPAWWRDQRQGAALQTGDLSPFHADIDFAKLAAHAHDDSGVPHEGAMDRILPSHFETEQGTDYVNPCGSNGLCKGTLRGRLQPYSIYVPHKPRPTSGYGLTLLLHALSTNYNMFSGSRNQAEFGERGPGSIVITPEGRGPAGWYSGYAGADVFEVWADVASHYRLNPDWTSITGYSMGGYGTFKLAAQYPDLFAKAQTTVGPPARGIWVPGVGPTGGERTNTLRMLASLRNIPFLMWGAATDDRATFVEKQTQTRAFDDLGLRYEFDVFEPADHRTLALNDQYQPAADFLGTTRVEHDPSHVTYVINPTMDYPEVGTVADHAYWLSGLRLRDASGDAPLGTIDVRSEGEGRGDPKPSGTQVGTGLLTGGNLPALAYSSQYQTWNAAPEGERADTLTITVRNVATAAVDVKRAHVSCRARLNIDTDGPFALRLVGCQRTITVG